MKITPIASSSNGNAILVSDGKTNILLDIGVLAKKIQEHIDISDIDAVLVSHSHSDHTKGLAELVRRGIKAFASKGCIDDMKTKHPFLIKEMTHLLPFQTGTFIVLPFHVVHDTPNPMGFLLKSTKTGEKLVYIVDSGYVKYDFSGVNYWLIEANHCEDILEASEMNLRLKLRIRKNHMSIQKAHKFLSTSDLDSTKEIHLLHLSNNNSNESLFIHKIQSLTGCPVYVHP